MWNEVIHNIDRCIWTKINAYDKKPWDDNKFGRETNFAKIYIARNKLKCVCLKLRLTRVFNFKWRRWQPYRWLSGTNNCVKAHVGDVIIVWRNTHDNTEPNAIWFPATLTDTDLNIQGIQVKYRTIGNCNIPATESRLWGTKWYHLFSAQIRMLRRGAFGIFIQRFSIERSRTASPVAVLQRASAHDNSSLIQAMITYDHWSSDHRCKTLQI